MLFANKSQSVEQAIALLMASFVLFALAVTYPFLSLNASGLSNQISVVDATRVLWESGYPLLAITCSLLILLFPLIQIALAFAVGLGILATGPVSQVQLRMNVWLRKVTPWAMADIFLLGVVVSLVKIGALAEIHVGIAFWSLAALIVTLAIGANAMCADTIWARAREAL
ncbi:MAG: paraquat-inducible protein A [Pseudomonadota bacterium]